MKSSPLTKLIARSNWDGVLEMLYTTPEEANTIISKTQGIVFYPIHQAVSKKSTQKPLPYNVLQTLINKNPKALDYNAFVIACDNPLTTESAIQVLFMRANKETLQLVQQNARHLSLLALAKDSSDVVKVLIDRYPFLLKHDILYQACSHGAVVSVEKILASGTRHQFDAIEILTKRHEKHHNETALDIACQLFDKNVEKRYRTLEICVKYASASRLEAGTSDPASGCPFIVAAIGWVPHQVCKQILQAHVSQKSSSVSEDVVETQAIDKLLQIAYDKHALDQIPEIFTRSDFINACRSRSVHEVQAILTRHVAQSKAKGQYSDKLISRVEGLNGLDVTIESYEEDNDAYYAILRNCVQYANARNMGLDYHPDMKYPFLFAAIGFLPKRILQSLYKQFKHEIRTSHIGRYATWKLFNLELNARKHSILSDPLNGQKRLPLHITRPERIRKPKLDTINEALAA